MDWQLYRSDEFGFELQYPSTYVIVQEANSPHPRSPQPDGQVLFQDPDLAQGAIAHLEIPQFPVRIFDNGPQLSVD